MQIVYIILYYFHINYHFISKYLQMINGIN